MAVTQLDLQTALVIIDLQKGIVSRPAAHPMDGVVYRAAKLADAFRRRSAPVVLVNVAGVAPGRCEQKMQLEALPSDWTDLVPELGTHQDDHLVTKQRWGAFTGTDLEFFLHRRGATQIVLAGVATSVGVESTARFAHELGFNIIFAVDAMTDPVMEAHTNSVERIFPRMGETGSTADILALLERS